MLWKNGLDVQICNFTRWHISAIVKENQSGNPWMFTGFYGHPNTSKTERIWKLLKMLRDSISIPWICMGDFIEITYQSEKVGASLMSYKQMEAFRETIDYCCFNVLPTQGLKFTWSINIQGRGFTNERLDCAMIDSKWKHIFLDSNCQPLPAIKSNHSPLHLTLTNYNTRSGRETYIFRYEAPWALRQDCTTKIKEAWSKMVEGVPLNATTNELRLKCKQILQKWNVESNKKTPAHIKRNMKRIASLQEEGN